MNLDSSSFSSSFLWSLCSELWTAETLQTRPLSPSLQRMLRRSTTLCRLQADGAVKLGRKRFPVKTKKFESLQSSSPRGIGAVLGSPPAIARGGDGPAPPREWGPPDEGGVFPSQRPPSELDLGRSLESEALPRPPPEFAPPEPAPTPRVLPETAAPDEEEEPGDIPPPLPLREPPLREPPLREPEELPWREPEPEPVEES